MEKNQTYEEFLHALILWGDQMCKHQTQPKISLFALLQHGRHHCRPGRPAGGAVPGAVVSGLDPGV